MTRILLSAIALLLVGAAPCLALDLADGDYRCNINDSSAAAGYVTIQGDHYGGVSWDDHAPRYPFTVSGDLITFGGPFGAFAVTSAQIWEDKYYGVYFNVLYQTPAGVGEQLICTLQ